jgi:hypothetical protein
VDHGGDEAFPNPPRDAPAHGVAPALHPAAIERLGDNSAVLVAAIFHQRGAVLRLFQQAAPVIPEALDILGLVARPRAPGAKLSMRVNARLAAREDAFAAVQRLHRLQAIDLVAKLAEALDEAPVFKIEPPEPRRRQRQCGIGGIGRVQEVEGTLEADLFALRRDIGQLAFTSRIDDLIERRNLARSERAAIAAGQAELEAHIARAVEGDRAGDEEVFPGLEIFAIGDVDGFAFGRRPFFRLGCLSILRRRGVTIWSRLCIAFGRLDLVLKWRCCLVVG